MADIMAALIGEGAGSAPRVAQRPSAEGGGQAFAGLFSDLSEEKRAEPPPETVAPEGEVDRAERDAHAPQARRVPTLSAYLAARAVPSEPDNANTAPELSVTEALPAEADADAPSSRIGLAAPEEARSGAPETDAAATSAPHVAIESAGQPEETIDAERPEPTAAAAPGAAGPPPSGATAATEASASLSQDGEAATDRGGARRPASDIGAEQVGRAAAAPTQPRFDPPAPQADAATPDLALASARSQGDTTAALPEFQPGLSGTDLPRQTGPSAVASGIPAAPISAQPAPGAGGIGAPELRVVMTRGDAGRQEIEIALSPAELGRVRMILGPEMAQLGVTVLAERPETLELLRRHAELLAAELAGLGYDPAGLSFTFGQERPDGQDTAPEDSDNANRSGAVPAAEAPRNRTLLQAPGRLDLRF